ncbi:MAG TPA: GreA/GreB family elongation factor [Verrucomicrobiae bacterium]|nr:GreA/GreB family elongation factor [Verrucomicrobiae bacterium]
MSKAFTRESDDAPELPVRPLRASPLPPGAKNYMTPDGAARLRAELELLLQKERPRAVPDSETVANPDARRRLQAPDVRIVELQRTLHTAVVVPVPSAPHEQVRFGATVLVRERNGEETRYRIVGVDETDIDRDWVSWLSPIAKALLNARLGQRVRFQFPSGEAELEIVDIRYE